MNNSYAVNAKDVEMLCQFTMNIAPNPIAGRNMIRHARERAPHSHNEFVCELMRIIQNGLIFGVWPGAK